MPAYIVATRESTTDVESLAAYNAELPGTRVEGLRALAVNGRVETLEGDAPDAVVLLEFPDWDTAKAWYDSPAYQKAREHRLRGGTFRLLLVEGR